MSAELLVDTDTKSKIADSAEAHREDAEAMARVMAVLVAVQKWAAAEERVARVYVSVEPEAFHIRLVAASPAYDFDLTTSLTNLAISLTDRGIDTIASRIPDGPPDEMAAFFDPTDSIVFTRR